jgi:hypothetical protein
VCEKSHKHLKKHIYPHTHTVAVTYASWLCFPRANFERHSNINTNMHTNTYKHIYSHTHTVAVTCFLVVFATGEMFSRGSHTQTHTCIQTHTHTHITQ